MRNSLQFFNGLSDLDEIVFEHRNKTYGAYELRRHYNERLQKAFLISVSLIMIVVIADYAFRKNPAIVVPPTDTSYDFPFSKKIEIVKTDQKQKVIKQSQQTNPEERPKSIVKDSTDIAIVKADSNQNANSATVDQASTSGNSGGDVVSLGNGEGKDDGGATVVAKKDPNEVVKFAEVMPSFPGGAKALSKYLGRKFNCNDSDHNGFSQEGKIVFKFVVMKDGTIKDISVVRETVSYNCVEQAKQILLNGPKWIPGMQNSEPVNVMVVQQITLVVE